MKNYFTILLAGLILGLLCSQRVLAAGEENLATGPEAAQTQEGTQAAPKKAPKVVYNPRKRRDPTLSPDDILILEDIAKKRRIAEEKRRKEEERKRLLEEKKKEEERLWQLRLLKEPELEVKSRFRIGGVIGQEVFFGNNTKKMYTAGQSFSVKGLSGETRQVKIVKIKSDSVVFSYKGRLFSKRI
ncbi:MAG: hypothetical protein IKP06_03370 [Elusimicrobiaceae bacterium]|nr:hypothetical protein [Elusimicrobiaceae bacterium]